MTSVSLPPAYLIPDWPAPQGIHCLVSTRECERGNIQNDIGQENSLQWLNQVHGDKVVIYNSVIQEPLPQADALYSREPKHACGVLTADCLPVFFCDQSGGEIAVSHAGWRGLAAGVLENTVSCFNAPPSKIMAWFGPAIGSCHFEVGGEVREAFIAEADSSISGEIKGAFVPSLNTDKWMADLFQLAKLRLNHVGLTQIYGGGLCTFCDEEKFYSYRRNKDTGRMASVIWKD